MFKSLLGNIEIAFSIVALLVGISGVAIAQNKNLPLNYNLNQKLTILATQQNEILHIGSKPYIETFTPPLLQKWMYTDTGKYYYDLTVLLFQKNLLQIEKEDVRLTVDILLDVNYGKTSQLDAMGGNKIQQNTRGLRVTGDITDKVSFETRIYENQFYYPLYIDSIADAREIALGFGRSKPFKTIGHDVGTSMGTVSVSPSKQLNIMFGHDKLFYGFGYRSLLLSDAATTFPMLKTTWQSKSKKWQYQVVKAWMQSLERLPATHSTEALFKRKGGAFNYLSYKASSRLEIGIFESTIHKNYQDSIGIIPLDYTFYLPLIGGSTMINGFDNANNTLVGLNASYIHKNNLQFYTQIAIDNIDKIGYQLGVKWFNCFGLNRTWFQTEYNSTPMYMYTQNTVNMLQNYTHVNQELAHPLGAGFDEFIIKGHYEKERLFVNLSLNYALRKRDSSTTYGENILLANDIRPNNSPVANLNSLYWNVEGGYTMNIKTNLQLFGAYTKRSLMGEFVSQEEGFWTLGLRTNLSNKYYDL